MGQISSAIGAAKIRRASRFVQPDGRTLLAALDMQSSLGRGPDLDAATRIAEGGPDAILTSWQVARRYPEAFARTGMILRLDGGLTKLGADEGGDAFSLLYRAEMGATIGADAVAVMAFPGANDETASLRRLAALVSEAEKIGMPVIAESIPGSWSRDVPWDAEHIMRAARVCVEIGADLIKTMAPPDLADFPDVLAGVEAPVLVLGGPKRDTEDEAVDYAAAVIAAGAAGVAFGRNIWAADDPTAMVRRLREAVHGP